MGDKTKIEWTEATWNPLRGCNLVSSGCTNCYAMHQAHRQSGVGGAYEGLTRLTEHGPVWTGEVRLVPELLDLPLRWKKPRRIFVNSMSDLFHEKVPDEFIMRVFEIMAFCTNHVFQLLTKRPQRMVDLLGEHYGRWFERGVVEMMQRRAADMGWCMDEPDNWPLPNIHLGISCEDQESADERIPLLLQTPAAVRWISAEPLLGPVDLVHAKAIAPADLPYFHAQTPLCDDPYCYRGGNHYPREFNCRWGKEAKGLPGLDWVVIGGESGPGARPMHPNWVRSIRDQCQVAGVPFFFKQWGEWVPVGDLKTVQVERANCVFRKAALFFPKLDYVFDRLGKKKAGAMLDGREWREYPAPCPSTSPERYP